MVVTRIIYRLQCMFPWAIRPARWEVQRWKERTKVDVGRDISQTPPSDDSRRSTRSPACSVEQPPTSTIFQNHQIRLSPTDCGKIISTFSDPTGVSPVQKCHCSRSEREHRSQKRSGRMLLLLGRTYNLPDCIKTFGRPCSLVLGGKSRI